MLTVQLRAVVDIAIAQRATGDCVAADADAGDGANLRGEAARKGVRPAWRLRAPSPSLAWLNSSKSCASVTSLSRSPTYRLPLDRRGAPAAAGAGAVGAVTAAMLLFLGFLAGMQAQQAAERGRLRSWLRTQTHAL